MKRLVQTIRRMAAVATIVAAALASALPAGAKLHYRGFVEGGIGITTISGDKELLQQYYESTGGGIGLGYTLATTHGIQIKNNFIGIGIGTAPAYLAMGDYSSSDPLRLSRMSFPLYINWRYDFFGTNSWNPYVGIKAGAFLPIEKIDCSGWYWVHNESNRVYVGIDGGMRMKLSSSAGLSFGLTVQTAANGRNSYHHDFHRKIGFSILAKVAFDF